MRFTCHLFYSGYTRAPRHSVKEVNKRPHSFQGRRHQTMRWPTWVSSMAQTPRSVRVTTANPLAIKDSYTILALASEPPKTKPIHCCRKCDWGPQRQKCWERTLEELENSVIHGKVLQGRLRGYFSEHRDIQWVCGNGSLDEVWKLLVFLLMDKLQKRLGHSSIFSNLHPPLTFWTVWLHMVQWLLFAWDKSVLPAIDMSVLPW